MSNETIVNDKIVIFGRRMYFLSLKVCRELRFTHTSMGIYHRKYFRYAGSHMPSGVMLVVAWACIQHHLQDSSS